MNNKLKKLSKKPIFEYDIDEAMTSYVINKSFYLSYVGFLGRKYPFHRVQNTDIFSYNERVLQEPIGFMKLDGDQFTRYRKTLPSYIFQETLDVLIFDSICKVASLALPNDSIDSCIWLLENAFESFIMRIVLEGGTINHLLYKSSSLFLPFLIDYNDIEKLKPKIIPYLIKMLKENNSSETTHEQLKKFKNRGITIVDNSLDYCVFKNQKELLKFMPMLENNKIVLKDIKAYDTKLQSLFKENKDNFESLDIIYGIDSPYDLPVVETLETVGELTISEIIYSNLSNLLFNLSNTPDDMIMICKINDRFDKMNRYSDSAYTDNLREKTTLAYDIKNKIWIMPDYNLNVRLSSSEISGKIIRKPISKNHTFTKGVRIWPYTISLKEQTLEIKDGYFQDFDMEQLTKENIFANKEIFKQILMTNVFSGEKSYNSKNIYKNKTQFTAKYGNTFPYSVDTYDFDDNTTSIFNENIEKFNPEFFVIVNVGNGKIEFAPYLAVAKYNYSKDFSTIYQELSINTKLKILPNLIKKDIDFIE